MMRKLIFLFLCLAPGLAAASSVLLDTAGRGNNTWLRLYDNCIGRAANLLLDNDVELTSVALPLKLLQGSDPGEIAVEIYSDFGLWSGGEYYSTPDQLIASTVREVNWGNEGYFINFDFTGDVRLQAGELYWIGVRLIDHQVNGDVLWEFNGVGDTGYFANLYQPLGSPSGNWQYTTNGAPGGFMLIGNASAVPLPAAVWLFGSALGLLGWMRRKGT